MIEMNWTAEYSMIGNGYGYTTHQKNLRAALERAGVVMSKDSDLAVHINTPTSFVPIPGAFNVLYTMYECDALPPDWPPHLQHPDLIVVPCTHNKHLFRRYTKKPIEVVWEGFNPDRFELRKREFPTDSKFLFLWVGASNPRKGFQHMGMAWELWQQRYPELKHKAHLFCKTTQATRGERTINYPEFDLTIEVRDWSLDQLTELYQMGHCFLFPSMGEGWGLTLMEAMATGMPSIYTPYSAMTDWVPKKHAYPVRFRMQQISTMQRDAAGRDQIVHQPNAASADPEDLVRQMHHVYTHYEEAAHKGYHAGLRVRELTWERSAAEFLEKVMPHYEAWREKLGVAA